MADMSYIHEFLVLAEYLSFSKAAEALFITQPTLSRHIAALERDLGVSLFVRSTTKVSLTEQGKIAYRHLSKAQGHIEEMNKQIALFAQKGTNTITMAVPVLWLGDYGESIMYRFKTMRPDAEVITKVMGAIDGMEPLVEGKADVLITAEGWYEPSQAITRVTFASEPYVALMADTCPLIDHDEVTFADLEGLPLVFIVNRYGNEPGNQQIFDLLEANGVSLCQIEWAPNAFLVPMVLRECGGVGIFPYCTRLMPQPYIRYKPLEGNRCCLDLNVSYRAANTNALIDDFCQAALDVGRDSSQHLLRP